MQNARSAHSEDRYARMCSLPSICMSGGHCTVSIGPPPLRRHMVQWQAAICGTSGAMKVTAPHRQCPFIVAPSALRQRFQFGGGLFPVAAVEGRGGEHLHGALVEAARIDARSEEHTSELQSRENLVCRLLLEKKNDRGTNRQH